MGPGRSVDAGSAALTLQARGSRLPFLQIQGAHAASVGHIRVVGFYFKMILAGHSQGANMGTLWAPRRLPFLFPLPLGEDQGEGAAPAGFHHGRLGGGSEL
jgi:hypothetical protein